MSNIDYSSDFARVIDVASLTFGWYFTHKKVQKQDVNYSNFNNGFYKFNLTPTIFSNNNILYPGFSMQLLF